MSSEGYHSNEFNPRATYGFNYISNFNSERYDNLKEEFQFADLNKNGTLSKAELEKYLSNKMQNILRDEYKPNFIDEIFKKMDENYDGVISLEEFSHFYYRLEDDFNLEMQNLKQENEDFEIKIKKIEAELKSNNIVNLASHIHLNIVQGNFSELHFPPEEIKNLKLRVSIQYHQGKKTSDISSRTIFSTLAPIWNDLIVFEYESNENLNMNFTIKLEQMEKTKRQKLELKTELGRVNFFYQNPDELPLTDQNFNILSASQDRIIGILQVGFEYIGNERVHKEKLVRQMKSQIEQNKLKISQIEVDYKYLQKLFGSIPQIQKVPEIFQYHYGFFDNFSLIHQPIDKYTPKFGYDLEKKIEYLAYWQIILFQYFPNIIFIFSLITCFSRPDFLTLLFCARVIPYSKFEWLKFQFLYAKLILVLVITTDFFWLIFMYPEWTHENLGILQGGHSMNCIVWILSLMNFIIKIMYEVFLIYIFHHVNHGYGYNLPVVRERRGQS